MSDPWDAPGPGQCPTRAPQLQEAALHPDPILVLLQDPGTGYCWGQRCQLLRVMGCHVMGRSFDVSCIPTNVTGQVTWAGGEGVQ